MNPPAATRVVRYPVESDLSMTSSGAELVPVRVHELAISRNDHELVSCELVIESAAGRLRAMSFAGPVPDLGSDDDVVVVTLALEPPQIATAPANAAAFRLALQRPGPLSEASNWRVLRVDGGRAPANG